MNTMAKKAMYRQPTNFIGLKTLEMHVDDVFLERHLTCQCGSETLRLYAERCEADDMWLDPISYNCTKCGQNHEFFNSQSDGYNAILCGVSVYSQGVNKEVIKCSSCNLEELQLKVSLAYNVDFNEPEELDGLDKEWKTKLSDLYDALSITATCESCKNEMAIGDWELS